jgi:ribosomal protein S18 acetylase RimI-like enzyme
VPGPSPVSELSRTDFLGQLDGLLAVYAAAMRPEAAFLPGRLSIMERHAGYPGFRAVAVTAPGGGPVVAFCYGFRGAPGQWWHDIVLAAVTAASGAGPASAWLGDTMEVAELHVRPDYQRQGIGRRLLRTLTAGREERAAVLSTQDADSPARRLYRSLGFTDLLTGFGFPGGGPPYAVMGAPLPLPAAPAGPGSPRRPAGPNPSSW